VIVTILNDSFMEDLGSTNGTLVNGNPVKKHFLQNNDVIELGKYNLKFIQEAGAQPAAAAADFEKTMVLRPSAMKAAAEQAQASGATGVQAAQAARQAMLQAVGTAAQAAGISADKPAAPAAVPAPAAPSKPSQPLGAIQLLSGGNAGRELELAKPLTTLGKPGVQVAVLTRRPQGYFITHVEGAQHPTVNGQAIGSAPHALKDHDLVEIAGIKMEFFLKS
jgi:hypothetical protein